MTLHYESACEVHSQRNFYEMSGCALYVQLCSHLFPPENEVWGKVMFLHMSVHRGRVYPSMHLERLVYPSMHFLGQGTCIPACSRARAVDRGCGWGNV